MASSVATVPESIFESLPAQPPTPPRHVGDAATDPTPLARPAPSDPRLSLQTPPNASSVPSIGTKSNNGSSRTTKKVEWSAHTQYKEPTEFIDGPKPTGFSSPAAPPSASSRSIRGILKPSVSSPLINSLNGENTANPAPVNIIDMLDSTIKQLAGSDRDSKIDAYMVLARALKASNNLPDRVALQGKMSLFMQFIQRDLGSKNQNSAPDASLINHALSLLATFLHFPAIASTITIDFGIFIIDHAIRSFQDASAPKKHVVRHLMQVLAFQNFSPKVMTADRVGRLVAALRNMESSLTGKSIIMSRIHIYKRLMKQAPAHMIVHSDWLLDMFTDMLSNISDIRSQAISLGSQAGFSLRTEKPLMRKVTEILQATKDGEVYIDFYISRLQEMLKDRQTSSAVPQIWSVVILFLTCPLQRWQYYAPWLTLVQTAFNMTESLTKQEANYAWSRYIYLSLTDAKASPKVLATLCQPISSQLRRKSSPKQLDEALKLKRTVIGSICSLYYYTFVPGNTRYPIDTVWDIAVSPVINLLVSLDDKPGIPGDSVMQASHLLVGLLDVTTPRAWRQDRIMDLAPIKADELPPIDSKWVRKNSEKVLKLVGAILEKKLLDLANKESLTYRLWTVLVGAIASASAKDIKVSEETAKFVACSFSLVAKVWSAGTPGEDEAVVAKFFASIQNLLAVLVQKLGFLPFMEKKLLMTSNGFEPILTPSYRNELPDQTQGVARIPALHLYHILTSLPQGVEDNDSFNTFFFSVLEPFFKDRPRQARRELVREWLHQLPRHSAALSAPWVLAAQNIDLLLDASADIHPFSPSGSEQPLGPMYREAVSLLDKGLVSHSSNLPLIRWTNLFNRVCEDAKSQSGVAGLALAVVEPLAKGLADGVFNNTSALKPQQLAMALEASSCLFKVAHMPRDAHAMEAARRRLWGTSSTTAKANTADPFDHLYRLGNSCLEFLYSAHSEPLLSKEVAGVLEAVAVFVKRPSAPQGLKMLNKLQDGICTWIRDEESRLMQNDAQAHRQAVSMLWGQVCAIMVGNGSLNKAQFKQAETLFTTALKSQDAHIFNKAADTWNKVVKDEEDLDCSDSLKSVMSTLRLKADIALPGSDADGFGAQSGRGREDTSYVALSSTSSHQDALQGPDSTASPAASTRRGNKPSRKRPMEPAAEATKTKRLKQRAMTPKRLRHENSQIQFAPIASTSPMVEESQHLTERQKEVRQRQRSEKNLYPEVVQSSDTAHGSGDEVETPKKANIRGTNKLNGTPQRDGQYGKHITSTPTPRRGQMLQMDDVNDPPSSPPLPRPNPLLEELKSRSRPDACLENWEFSSPPASPNADEEGQPEAGRLQSNVLTEIQQSAAGMVTTSQNCASADQDESANVIPSSAYAENKSTEDAKAESKLAKRRTGRSRRGKPSETVSSVAHESACADAEIAESQGDDSVAVTLPALADAENVAADHHSKTAKKRKSSRRRKSQRGRSAVREASPKAMLEIIIPSSIDQDEAVASSPPAVPSTPADEINVGEIDEPRKMRKRKRSEMSSVKSTPRKRRSSGPPQTEAETEVEADQGGAAAEEAEEAQSLPELQQTGKGTTDGVEEARKRTRQQHPGHAEVAPPKMRTRSQSRAMSRPSSSGEEYRREDGDTDEEIMSQLVTEATAATNNQPKEEDIDMIAVAATKPAVAEVGETRIESSVEEEDGRSVMSTLRQGLDQLRSTTLSREALYKMEEMLFDMKREMYEAEYRGRKRE